MRRPEPIYPTLWEERCNRFMRLRTFDAPRKVQFQEAWLIVCAYLGVRSWPGAIIAHAVNRWLGDVKMEIEGWVADKIHPKHPWGLLRDSCSVCLDEKYPEEK